MKTVAIIQARMTASRLPNKVLLHLHGYPIIEWVYRRVKQSRQIDQLSFAIPDTAQNDVLAWYLESIGAGVFRGSETNLIDRYFHAARAVSADVIVRVCADNPLICASEIDHLISYFHQNKCDYAYNHIPLNNRYPDGLGAEICSISLLEELHAKTTDPVHREHIFNYVMEHPNQYTIKTFDPPKEIAYPELKFDLDTMEDYQHLLAKNYRIDMNAKEIVTIACMQ